MSSLSLYLTAAATDHPDRPALEIGEERWTYRQLAAAVEAAAAGLARRGIGRGDRVAVWMPKQAETYIGLFACLYLGAAYVPVDIAAPPGRAAWILTNGGCRGLVCCQRDFARLPRPLPEGLAVVVLADGDGDGAGAGSEGKAVVSWRELAGGGPGGAPAPTEEPGDLAYILYTSGSTGEPKGVAISHRAAAAFAAWAGDLAGLGPEDRVSNHAALSFDLSVFDVFSTVRAGAALLPVPNWAYGGGYPFARFIQDRGITVWYSVPTILDRIAGSQARKPVDLGSLRVVFFAGEPFPKAGLVAFQRQVPQAKLFNLYGPTETNVCLYHPVAAEDLASDAPLPIGRPCPYNQVLVRGEEGGVGELLVAGDSLMEGYWRGGEIDTAAFVSPGDGGRRYYPTGDFVSRDPQGRYLFLGRRDSQIKLGGYRIELGEIEEALIALPEVAEAAVVSDGESLVAFAVGQDGAGLVEEEIHRQLQDRLPPYMLPRQIRGLAALPRTERGKVDRRSLLAQVEGAG